MELVFPTGDRSPSTFLSVHSHDGKVHKKPGFDHCLSGRSPPTAVAAIWTERVRLAQHSVIRGKATELVLRKQTIYEKGLKGELQNEDGVMGAATSA
jgi:hypothetical protein